jgi:hypothetical protein
MFNDKQIRLAFIENDGFKAFWKGMRESDVPYDLGTNEEMAWRNGLEEAESTVTGEPIYWFWDFYGAMHGRKQ